MLQNILRPCFPLYISSAGFLSDLLVSLIDVSVGGASRDHTHSVGVQTEGGREGGGGVLTLAERLRALDKDHMARLAEEEEGEDGGEGERWRREWEEQMRNKMEKEMEHFR